MKLNSHELARRIRLSVLEMCHSGGSSHIGSVYSCTDIIAVLYSECLKVFPSDPTNLNRDRFVLSKGHAGAGIYAALAHSGFFDVASLGSHYKNGSFLSGHVSHKGVPGVEFSTGSLGHGLPVGIGMALAAKMNGATHRIFCLISDGECNEGTTWESALLASHHALNNLVLIIDSNKLQSLKTTAETLNLEPLGDKWRAFGWRVIEIDGHAHNEICAAFTVVDDLRPTVVIANTVKGKGVTFMENNVLWHYRSPQGSEYLNAKKELEAK